MASCPPYSTHSAHSWSLETLSQPTLQGCSLLCVLLISPGPYMSVSSCALHLFPLRLLHLWSKFLRLHLHPATHSPPLSPVGQVRPFSAVIRKSAHSGEASLAIFALSLAHNKALRFKIVFGARKKKKKVPKAEKERIQTKIKKPQKCLKIYINEVAIRFSSSGWCDRFKGKNILHSVA